jgi:hypothetical protein
MPSFINRPRLPTAWKWRGRRGSYVHNPLRYREDFQRVFGTAFEDAVRGLASTSSEPLTMTLASKRL